MESHRLTAIGCFLLAIAGSGTASAAGHGGPIYFADEGPHFKEFVFSVSPNGRHRERLSESSRMDAGSPAVSPNGRKIAFQRFHFGRTNYSGAIWTMRTDGSHPKRLTSRDGYATDPSYSPDGRRIVYESKGHIMVMDANGRHRESLTHGHFDAGPVFSPDGKKIAFERENEIWQMHPDGKSLRRLAPEGKYPDYSPDGKLITFSVTQNGPGGKVWLMKADGSHRHALGPGQDSVFSADGKKLAYTGSGKSSTDANVSIMRINGSHPRHVTSGCCPAWN